MFQQDTVFLFNPKTLDTLNNALALTRGSVITHLYNTFSAAVEKPVPWVVKGAYILTLNTDKEAEDQRFLAF